MGNGNAGMQKAATAPQGKAVGTDTNRTARHKQAGTRVSVKRKVNYHAPDSYVSGTSKWNLDQVLLGNPKMAVQNDPEIVRIFLSSTFTDTRHERNALMESVFPTLKSYCQDRGYDFQVVDMRWGVREEAEDDHLATDLCLQELEACKNMSTGPNFVALLSHKYGFRPFPRKIPAVEFEKIISAIAPNESDTLKRWFCLDENAKPPEYILQPISKNLPDYKSKDRTLKKAAVNQWWKIFENLQNIIKSGVQNKVPKRLHYYTMSVTEREITHGVVNQKEADRHCISFIRKIEGIDSAGGDEILPKYRAESEEDHRLMEQLRDNTVPSTLPTSNILRYVVPWSNKGIDPQVSDIHKDYIQNFCSDFERYIKSMIDAGIEEKKSQTIVDELYTEVVQHYSYYRNKCERFNGRQDVLQRVKSYMTGEHSTQPLIVHGSSGSGKTAILALAAQNAHPWMGGKCVTVFRFLGTTRSSSSLVPLLKSLTEQISRVYISRIKESQSLRELVQNFKEALMLATRARPLVLILDSLDQLDASDGGRHLHWLPKELPANVKLILSTLPDEQYQSYQRCLGLYRKQSSYLDVPPMDDNDICEVLDNWLEKDKRCLAKHQKDDLIAAFRACPVPLYMKLSYSEAVRWHSYDPPADNQLRDTITDTIHALLWRIERKHGELIVSHALGCLTASQNGVGEAELEDLLSLSDDVLNDVYQFWTPPVRRLPPLLWVRIRSELSEYLVERGTDNMQVLAWNHRQFMEVAHKRYLEDAGDIFRYHLALSEFFLGLWSDCSKEYVNKKGKTKSALRYVAKQPLRFENGEYNLRKLHQLPYHLIQAQELKALKTEVLFNYNFLVAKMAATSFTTVIRDFKMARATFPTDQDLQVLTETLQLSQEALSFDSKELAGQLLGRIHGTGSSGLLGQAQEALNAGTLSEEAIPLLSLLEAYEDQASQKNKYINNLLEGAKKCKTPTLVPHRGFLTPPGGRLIHQLAGHTAIVSDIDISFDGKLVITGAGDSTVKMWDVAEGELRHSMDMPHPVGRVKLITDDQNLLVSCNGGIVYLIDVQTSFIQTQYQGLVDDDRADLCMPIALCLDTNDREYLAAMRNNFIDLWDIEGSRKIKSWPVNFSDWSTEHEGYHMEGRHFLAFNETVVYAGYKSASYHVFSAFGRATGLTVPLFKEAVLNKYNKTPSFCSDTHDHISALALSGDGSVVFACNGGTGNIHLNKVQDGSKITIVRGTRDDVVSSFYIFLEGDWIYMAKDVNVGMWNPRTNEKFTGLPHPFKVRKVVGANTKTVATIAEDSIVRLWDTTLEPFEADLSSFTGKVKVGDNADMSALQSQFDTMFAGTIGEDANLFDTTDLLTKVSARNYWSSSETGSDFAETGSNFESRVLSRFFLFDNGDYVAIANYDLSDSYSVCFSVWDLTHMACVRRMLLPSQSVYIHTIYGDDTVVLSENRKIKIMDLRRFTISQVLQGKSPDNRPPFVLYISKRKELVTESRGGRYLKIYDPLGGEMTGELIPSTLETPEYLSTILHPQVHLKYLKVNESATILAALYDSGPPTIYLWNLEERKVLHVVNGRSLFPGLKDESVHFSTIGDNVVVWKDTDKLHQPAGDDVAIVSTLTDRSGGHAKKKKEKDGIIGDLRKIPILRQMGKSYVQMIGITKDNKGFILGERCVGNNANKMKTSSDEATLVTWCDQPKEKTLQYWAFTDDIEALGTFTPGQEMSDLAVRPGCKELIIDSTTGAVKLKLSHQFTDRTSVTNNAEEKMFRNVDLNVPFPTGGEEDFIEEDDDPDMDIDYTAGK